MGSRTRQGVALSGAGAVAVAALVVGAAGPAAAKEVYDFPAKVTLKTGQSVVAALEYMGNDWTPKVKIVDGPKKAVTVRPGGLPPGQYVSYTAVARKAGKAVVTFTEDATGVTEKLTVVVKSGRSSGGGSSECPYCGAS